MPNVEAVTQFRIPITVASCYEKDGWWYVQLEHSWESLGLGPVGDDEQAPFGIGETVDIIIRRRV